MRLIILLFLLAISARSQEHTTFRIYPQTVFAGPLTQYVASICNTGTVSINVQAAQVWAAAETLGMRPATNANILRACEESGGLAWQRKVLLVGEGLTYGSALALGTETIGTADPKKPIGKFVRVGLPAIGLTVRVVTTIVKKTELSCDFKEELPRLPNYFLLAAGQCSDYLMYGTPIR